MLRELEGQTMSDYVDFFFARDPLRPVRYSIMLFILRCAFYGAGACCVALRMRCDAMRVQALPCRAPAALPAGAAFPSRSRRAATLCRRCCRGRRFHRSRAVVSVCVCVLFRAPNNWIAV